MDDEELIKYARDWTKGVRFATSVFDGAKEEEFNKLFELAKIDNDEKTVLYVECKDKNDEHYNELLEMKNELIEFANIYNLDLIALPMSDAIYFKNERLPATYANFLFANGAVLVPIYGVNSDKEALEVFKNIFKDRDIIAIDCSVLIRQHGSLHCVTMNFA